MEDGNPFLQAHFTQILGSLFPETAQRAVRAVWAMDNLGQTRQRKGDDSFYRMTNELVMSREEIGHLDHLVLQKLDIASQSVKGAALLFFNQGACRREEHLTDLATLKFVLKIHLDG